MWRGNATVLYYVTGTSDLPFCADFPKPEHDLRENPAVERYVRTTLQSILVFGWRNVGILSTDCALESTPPHIQDVLQTSPEANNLTIWSAIDNNGCSTPELDNVRIFMLSARTSTEAAISVYGAYRRGWLKNDRVIIFAPGYLGSGTISLQEISEILMTLYGSQGIKAAAIFTRLALYVGTWHGHALTQIRVRQFFEAHYNGESIEDFQSRGITELQTFRLMGIIRFQLSQPYCKNPLPVDDILRVTSGDPAPDGDRYINAIRPYHEGSAVLRLRCLSVGGCIKYDEGGNIISGRPVLLLPELDPAYFPVDIVPVRLQVTLIHDPALVPNISVVISVLTTVINPVIHTEYHSYATSNCTIPPWHNDADVAIFALVDTPCAEVMTMRIADAAEHEHPVFWQALDRLEDGLLPTIDPSYIRVGEPPAQRFDIFRRLNAAFALRDTVLVTDNLPKRSAFQWTDGPTVSFSGQPNTTLIERIKNLRLPVFIIDVAPAKLVPFFDLARAAGLCRKPYFFILPTRTAHAFTVLSDISEYSFFRERSVLLLKEGYDSFFDVRAAQALLYAALERKVNSFEFSHSLTAAREAARTGVKSINVQAPVFLDDTPIAIQNGATVAGALRVATLDQEGQLVTFAQVLADSNLAIFDFQVQRAIQPPTDDEYRAVASGRLDDSDGSSSGSSSASSRALSSGDAAGLAIASTLCLCLVLLIIYRAFERRKHHDLQQTLYPPHDFGGDLKMLPLTSRPFEVPFELPAGSLQLGDVLAESSTSTVLRGYLRRGSRAPALPVAVKIVDVRECMNRRSQVLQEMLMLAQFRRHRNVVHLEGVITVRPNQLLIATELCHRTTLSEYLRCRDGRRSVSWAVKFRLAADVADGLAVIHGSNIVHMNVSASNVLVTAEGVCKIADFGMAVGGGLQSMSMRPLSVRWMAPELLRASDRQPTFACDVWSLGVLLFEVATNGNALPYAALSNAEVIEAVLAGRSPGMIADSPEEVGIIAKACRSMVPEERPRMVEVAIALRQMSAAHSTPESRTASLYEAVVTTDSAAECSWQPQMAPAVPVVRNIYDNNRRGPNGEDLSVSDDVAPRVYPQMVTARLDHSAPSVASPAGRSFVSLEAHGEHAQQPPRSAASPGRLAGYVSHNYILQMLREDASFRSTTL